MPSNKNELVNILFQNHVPILEYYLKKISEDYAIDYNELESKYIKPFKCAKKSNTNKKGRKTNYSIFLSDKKVDDVLREKHGEEVYDNMQFSEKSKEKSRLWKAMSKTDKDVYKKQAEIHNNSLLNESNEEE